MLGCALCAHGEPEFAMKGFLLQISAQVAECVKNLIGEVVMSGSGQAFFCGFGQNYGKESERLGYPYSLSNGGPAGGELSFPATW